MFDLSTLQFAKYSSVAEKIKKLCYSNEIIIFFKAVPLHAMEALGGRGGIAPTHSRPRH
jgi:hypothetical protein